MTRLCDLSSDGNTVTSVSWSERGHQLAVGTHHGYVTVWDVQASKQVSIYSFIYFEYFGLQFFYILRVQFGLAGSQNF